MSPRAFTVIFTLFILSVMVYVGQDVLRQKLDLNRGTIPVYFLKGEKLRPVDRPLLNEQSALKEALRSLLEGPDEKAQSQGYYSVLPTELKIYGYELRGDTVMLKTNDAWGSFSGGSTQVQAALGQLVYTATAQKGIKKVGFEVEGRKGPLVIGGEGYIIDKPLGRSDIKF